VLVLHPADAGFNHALKRVLVGAAHGRDFAAGEAELTGVVAF
jgi:hypothetical protein